MEDGCRYDWLQRCDAMAVDACEFAKLEAQPRPFVLTSVHGPDFAVWWTGEVLRALGNELVHFVDCDVTGGGGGCGVVKEAALATLAEECQRLSSRSHYAYAQTDILGERALPLVQLLRRNLPKALPSGDDDLFGHWPRGLCPSAPLLTLAGAGARCPLTYDGFGASQWHLCISGHMRLKLLRADCDGDGSSGSGMAALAPHAEPFGICDEAGRPMIDVASRLSSELDLFAAELPDAPGTHLDAFAVDLARWPAAVQLPRAVEILLGPGEMMVASGAWWVQPYFDEPTWSVCAHYLSVTSLPRVLEGVLQRAGIAPATLPLERLPPAEQVDLTLAAAFSTKGRGDGRVILARLRQLDARDDARREEVLATAVAVTPAPVDSSGGESHASEPAPNCEICGRPATRRCGRCRNLWLCGAECQRRSWPEHRQVCVTAVAS
eukprot:NODE_5173_length_1801_cov_3.681601.p1 GENE.NODE_5173_length_1801_cov_3.681601~~NODE_5173_length_1801_cov_3.681601.p1  ORF type:complete len:437 (-),score=141.52 NODE_5173_length_1801_cov_3.681601:445-1755(-)